MGVQKLNKVLKDRTLLPFLKGIMLQVDPKKTRFSINFFTSIGLGGLTFKLMLVKQSIITTGDSMTVWSFLLHPEIEDLLNGEKSTNNKFHHKMDILMMKCS